MHITNELLASIFAESSAFCGKEDVLHAVIYHQLKKAGHPHTSIAREHALSGNRVDIMLHGDSIAGDFSTTQKKPLALIEVKGGAYGNRNALKDEIDANGYCADMPKLKPEAAKGIEAWFFCVDMPELGRAVSPLKMELVSEQCSAHGLAFAYYCQGEDKFYMSSPKKKLAAYPVAKITATRSTKGVDFLLTQNDRKLAALARDCLMINGHEANNTALLYDCLRASGFGVAQLSLETYFSFAAQPGSRMQERPDLVVFNGDFDGRFNLYKEGNAKLSNDQHKLAHIETIFEVKGGAAMAKKSDKAIMKDYLADIHKLSRWREGAAKTRSGTEVQTIFLGVDTRVSGLSAEAVEALVGESKKLGNGLIYINRDQVKTARA
jgi:hypothetical protein